jgi:hypothetical protein
VILIACEHGDRKYVHLAVVAADDFDIGIGEARATQSEVGLNDALNGVHSESERPGSGTTGQGRRIVNPGAIPALPAAGRSACCDAVRANIPVQLMSLRRALAQVPGETVSQPSHRNCRKNGWKLDENLPHGRS